MANFCLNPAVADSLKKAFKSQEIDIATLYTKTSKERNEIFGKYAGKENAASLNASFESAILSNQKDSLKKWAQKSFMGLPSDKKTGILAKIDNMQELLTPENENAFMQDLASERLGISVSADEAKKITEIAGKMEQAMAKPPGKFGLPNIEYFKGLKEMEDYIASRNPTSKLRVATSTIGRGMMLGSLKSPFLNIESNTLQGIIEGFGRRLSSGQVRGVAGKEAMEYVKTARNIYAKTGYDITRLADPSYLERRLGEKVTNTQGKGSVRAIGRAVEDIVFKRMQGAPDVAFAAVHRADTANLMATRIAKQEGLKGSQLKARASEIIEDALSMQPKTIEGQKIAEQGIADAMYATYTNDSRISAGALKLRDGINTMTGDLRLGDNLMPFVKTPANVISAGLDASGLGFVKALYKLGDAVFVAKDTAALKGISRDIARSGVGLTGALMIASTIKPEDFIGAYPTNPSEQELLKAKNGRENSIKIGDKWVSLDYFGPLAAPLTGMLYAKKYGSKNGKLGTALYYSKGAGSQLVSIPGFDVVKDMATSGADTVRDVKETPQDIGKASKNFGLDFLRARMVPGIVNDIAKSMDPVERETNIKKTGDEYGKIKASIPGLRQTLPEKKNTFGETVKGEGTLTNLLFGARVKTGTSTEVTGELDRLVKTGNTPTISDVDKTSDRVKQLKTKLSKEKYDQFLSGYGKAVAQTYANEIKSAKYRELTDEEKKEKLNKTRDETLEKWLKKYGYKKPKSNK